MIKEKFWNIFGAMTFSQTKIWKTKIELFIVQQKYITDLGYPDN
jgi:hypothetical protein